MKIFFVLLGLFIFPALVLADDTPSEKKIEAACGSCHGVPFVEANREKGFLPGAHLAHEKVECVVCHASPGIPGHNNDIIELRPELNYDLGSKIPWPGSGGGSCGGGNNSSLPLGCHAEKKDSKCYWLPGRICKSIYAP